MNTKTLLMMLIALVMTIPSTFAAGGDSKGGGGRVHVCRDKADPKKILSVELLDLWRGRRPVKILADGMLDLENGGYGLTISESTDPVRSVRDAQGNIVQIGQVKKAFDRLHLDPNESPKSDVTGDPAYYYNIAINSPNFGDMGKNSTGDGNEPKFGDQSDQNQVCGFEQLAWFIRGDSIIIQPDLFAFLTDPVHPERRKTLSAFYEHESLYRASGLKNSLKVQELVAYMNADVEDKDKIRQLTSEVLSGAVFRGDGISWTPDEPNDPNTYSLAVKNAVVDLNSSEPIYIKIKNHQDRWIHRALGLWFAPDRTFRGIIEFLKEGQPSITLNATSALGYMEEKTFFSPLSAQGLLGWRIQFTLNIIGDGDRNPPAEVTVLQGKRVIGQWTDADLGKKNAIPSDRYSRAVGRFLVTDVKTSVSEVTPAKPRSFCQIQANHWTNGENLGTGTWVENYSQCYTEATKYFNSTIPTGSDLLHVRKNSITRKTWTTQYKVVKVTYTDENNQQTKFKLKRDTVINGPVTTQEIPIKSGWKCWTQGDCN